MRFMNSVIINEGQLEARGEDGVARLLMHDFKTPLHEWMKIIAAVCVGSMTISVCLFVCDER